jgi:hypothetical protein
MTKEVAISRFESNLPSQPVRSLRFAQLITRISAYLRRFLRARRSPAFPNPSQNSRSVPKISACFLGNSRFAESQGGDRFDVQLRDRPASLMPAIIRIQAANTSPNVRHWHDLQPTQWLRTEKCDWKTAKLPKLHTRVRFPSPAPSHKL